MYAVIQQINGAFTVKFEGENLDSLKYNYHNWCAQLWNDTGAVDGVVKLVDSNLDVVEGYIDFISHPAKNA
jgi:hypothetical protein